MLLNGKTWKLLILKLFKMNKRGAPSGAKHETWHRHLGTYYSNSSFDLLHSSATSQFFNLSWHSHAKFHFHFLEENLQLTWFQKKFSKLNQNYRQFIYKIAKKTVIHLPIRNTVKKAKNSSEGLRSWETPNSCSWVTKKVSVVFVNFREGFENNFSKNSMLFSVRQVKEKTVVKQ